MRDEQHLTILSIFHYIYGGLALLGACIGLMYLGVAAAILASPEMTEDEEVPAGVIGGIVAIVGGCSLLVAIAVGGFAVYAGVSLAKHRNHLFCMIVAAIMCLNIPLGTILGVFTLVVLSRSSVRTLFEESRG